MILPDYLNYNTYHSSSQTAYHKKKKVSGTSGTSQHACITEKPDLHCFLHEF